jgi:integrase
LRALRRLQRESKPGVPVFVSERGTPLAVAGYQRMIARLGKDAGFPFLIHSHMLRHACGYGCVGKDGSDPRRVSLVYGARLRASEPGHAHQILPLQ